MEIDQSRVQREQAAYDEGAIIENNARLQRRFSHVFECPNTLHAEVFFEKMIQESQTGSETCALDYGCHTGWFARKLHGWGFAKLYGIDISNTAIQEATERHSDIGKFEVMDAHRTTFADNYFNLVVGRAILHHLEFETAIKEIHRILKPGGRAIFIEPLRDNPAGKFIRLLTSKARTKDELPLSARQIEWANSVFGKQHHLFFNLFSVAFGMGSSLVSKDSSNFSLRLAHRADLKIARGPLKYWMRQAVLVWEKT